jgi:hypothetical protein
MNSWCHPGGDTRAFGGAVTVQVLPEHENAGKIVRPPIVLPCVLDTAATSDTRMPDVAPEVSCPALHDPDQVVCAIAAAAIVHVLDHVGAGPAQRRIERGFGGRKVVWRALAHIDLELPTVDPVCIRHRHDGLRESLVEIRRDVHLDP